MRIVQYVNGGQPGCGVQVGDDVFYSGYADTMSLIRDGERGLERAQQSAESTDPVRFDRIIEPLRPGKDLRLGCQLPKPRRRGGWLRVPRRGGLGLHQADQAP